MIARLLALLLLMALAITGFADVTTDSAAPWKIVRTYLLDRGYLDKDKRQATGLALYTTATDSYGVAFRCQNKRLYVFVAIKKVDFGELMTRRSLRSRKWVVSYSVDDNEMTKEDWATLLDGQVIAPRKRSTSREIFEAARDGTTIRIDPRYGKEVAFEIPADSAGLFDSFVKHCDFSNPPG